MNRWVNCLMIEDIPEEYIEEAEEWRGKLIEALAEVDDTLLERYVEDHESITPEEILTALRKSAIAGSVVPVLCGASFKNKGIQSLLDAITAFLPSPVDIGSVTGVDPRDNSEIKRAPDDNEPFSALAFKIATDPFVGRLAFLQDLFRGTEGRRYSIECTYRKEGKNKQAFQDACQQADFR